MATCDECGAAEQRGLSCREQWDELIALEFSDAQAGSVHFLTVACYQLQHPQAFPLRTVARDGLRRALADVVLRDRPVTEVRDELARTHDGATRVRPGDGEDVAVATPDRWSCTVADVGQPDAGLHVARVRQWAGCVLEDLDR